MRDCQFTISGWFMIVLTFAIGFMFGKYEHMVAEIFECVLSILWHLVYQYTDGVGYGLPICEGGVPNVGL